MDSGTSQIDEVGGGSTFRDDSIVCGKTEPGTVGDYTDVAIVVVELDLVLVSDPLVDRQLGEIDPGRQLLLPVDRVVVEPDVSVSCNEFPLGCLDERVDHDRSTVTL